MPQLVNADELAPAQRGSQLPPTLRLPGRAVRTRYHRLAAYLQASDRQILPRTPLALTIHHIKGHKFEIQLHISPELTSDRTVCMKLHGAIGHIIQNICADPYPESERPSRFRNHQDWEAGTSCFYVKVSPHASTAKSLDVMLSAVIQVARFVQVVDGDIERLPDLLSDRALFGNLQNLAQRLAVNGAKGQLSTEASSSIPYFTIEATAIWLVRDGHFDLAMMVLAIGIRHSRAPDLSRPIDAFLSLLEDTSVLSDDRDFETALKLIDQLLLSNPEVGLPEREAARKRCFSSVSRCLLKLKMPAAALALTNRVHLKRSGDSDELDGAYQSALEEIWNAADSSNEILMGVVDALGSMTQSQERANHLLETPAPRAVLQSPQRGALKTKGFEFNYSFGAGGIVVVIASASGFVPGEHGEDMVEYAESLLQDKPSVAHVSTFCLPVIDFLMDHFAQLPRVARERLLALSDGVLNQVEADPRGVPILKSAQALIQARVLLFVREVVQEPDRPRALNLAAWAHQNRQSLFSRLQAGTYEMILAQVHAALETSDADLAAHQVDPRAMREAMAGMAAVTHARVGTLFRQAVFAQKPEVTQALFQCWKTISGDDDLCCHNLLLFEARVLVGTTKAPPGSARQSMAVDAWAELKASLESGNANLATAMALHEMLIDFIAGLPDFGESPEWALKTLAEMAADPALQQLRIVTPNAAAWPFWLHARMSLGALPSGDECFALLSTCATLDGVMADLRFDALFVQGIRRIIGTERRANERYPLALQAFITWQSVRRNGIGEPFPRELVETLVSGLRKLMVKRAVTGVDSRQAMAALMGQLLRADTPTALTHLASVMRSKAIRQDHPLLGVALCVRCAEHFAKWGDTVEVQQLVAKALVHLPDDPQLADEARVLLEPFLQQAEV